MAVRYGSRFGCLVTSPEQRIGVNGSPYPLGTPDDRIFQAGHYAGCGFERASWSMATGAKYPQDVWLRFQMVVTENADLRADLADLTSLAESQGDREIALRVDLDQRSQEAKHLRATVASLHTQLAVLTRVRSGVSCPTGEHIGIICPHPTEGATNA